MGVCYEFRYEYANFAERWCKAPPGGEFSDAGVLKKRILITYYDYERRGTRRQPPGGWQCPTK